jgi:hypothetical protein
VEKKVAANAAVFIDLPVVVVVVDVDVFLPEKRDKNFFS